MDTETQVNCTTAGEEKQKNAGKQEKGGKN